VDQVRLFRNHPGIRWCYRVHEQILPAVRRHGGEVVPTDVVIEHAGFADPAVQGPKVDRNLRLLELELAEHPDDPFVLYNLGAVALTSGHHDKALDYLRRSQDRSRPGDSIARKLHALMARAHYEAGRPDDALAACRAGLAQTPDAPELLHWQAVLLSERGDLEGAERCLLRVLGGASAPQFMGCDAGLRGYRTRHFLADLSCRQGRDAEAEGHWRAAVAERPDFTPGWQALSELLLGQQRWAELDEALAALAQAPQAASDVALLRARALLARQEYAAARQLLEGLTAAAPEALAAWVLLSHALLREGRDGPAAERALRTILERDPGNAEARHNLDLLRRQHGRPAEGTPRQARNASPGSADPGAGASGSCATTADDDSAAPQPTTVLAVTPAGASARAPSRQRVSLCMIVRDEEDNLPACLGSAADLVDEVIVVDTGSQDRTKEVAARYGARLFDFPWVDSFAAARNESLRHASGDWVFWMDADDRLDEANRAKLRTLLAGLKDEQAGYVISCLCLPDPLTQAATAVHHLRLFRNLPALRWSYRVHEQILPALRRAGHAVRFSDVVIHHTGYQDPALRGRKLQRDLRLLERDRADDPDDPFTLFNLGQIYREQGRNAEALTVFRRSLQGSRPGDSIVRKLYALLAQCHSALGQQQEALAVCRQGRAACPDDVELAFQEGAVRRHLGDLAGAEACWQQVLTMPAGEYFASMLTGLRGHLTRHNLAGLYRETGREAEAEGQWQAALKERPDFEPAWRGLAELLLAQRRWADVEALTKGLEAAGPRGELGALAIRARVHLARKEFAAGRRLLEDACPRFAKALEPRQLLSYVLLQEGRDWEAAEAALRAILALDPANSEARQNLTLLAQQQGRPVDLPPLPAPTLEELYRRACNTPSDIHEHCPTLCALARECRQVTELGVRGGAAPAALLYAQPAKLVCYDPLPRPELAALQSVAGQTEFVVHQADVLAVDLEETDLLLLDTRHVYEQRKAELGRHAGQARRYVVVHGTTTYAAYGEQAGHAGVWPAVEEFLAAGTFRLKERYPNNHGLTVLERVRP
jgi:tetratricopeptide (TPR) repeat protein